MSREPARSGLKFCGGRACLDFANSLNWRLTEAPVDLIPDYAAFLAWSEAGGTLATRTVVALRRNGAIRDGQARTFMGGVHRLRTDLIALSDALSDGRPPDSGAVNRALSDLPPQPALAVEAGRFVFDLDGSDLRQPLWPILWSLTAMLASSDADRIGTCQAHGCGWFFIDESPNRSRHWCSDGCGNRERVRRSYDRRRATRG